MNRRSIGKWCIGIGVALFLADLCIMAVNAANPSISSRSVLQLTMTPNPLQTATAYPSPSSIVSGTPTLTPIAMSHIPDLLNTTWSSYKADFVQSDGRVIDHGRQAASTSEGESYALLRAAWMHDRATFDLVWTWTRNNLQVRKTDSLLGYLWGYHPSTKKWFILDADSATDADEDTATALLFASKQWHSKAYYKYAVQLISDIWKQEVTVVKGHPYLTAGNWAPSWTKPGPALNPSYYAPYEYRLFAGVDKKHDWKGVVSTSYKVLNSCSSSALDTVTSTGLPPNWCAISRSTGRVATLQATNLGTVYGFDAFRCMWRTAVDYAWNKEPRAKTYLDGRWFLHQNWTQHSSILAQYTHDGAVLEPAEDPTVYGGNIGAFVFSDPASAIAIAQSKLLSSYTNLNGVAYWGPNQRYSYYEQNWVWFGLALIDNQLPNLYS